MNPPSHSIKHASLLNLAGALAPLLVIVLTLPFFLPLVGEYRYGAFMLLWSFIGYMAVLDLGLGRAVSQRIALLDNTPEQETSVASVLWGGGLISLTLGLLGGFGIATFTSWFATTIFSVPEDLYAELHSALLWMILALPVATLNSVLSGALQGRHAFVSFNIAQVSGGMLAQLLPFALALCGVIDLAALFISLIVARTVQLGLLLHACREVFARARPAFVARALKDLLHFGGWVSVSSALNPVLELTDRFVIGHRLGLVAVTAYTVPYTLATRLILIPGSLASVLFPRFASSTGTEAQELMLRARASLTAVMTPLVTLGMALTPLCLSLWLGESLGARMAPVAVILLAGIWVNALAFLPYAYLQGQGRPDLTAKLHLLEVVPYLAFLWWATGVWGIEGAALAWALRVTVDGVLLYIVAGRRRDGTPADRNGLLWAALLVASAAISVLIFLHYSLALLPLSAVLLAAALLWQWKNTPPDLLNLWHALQNKVKR